jgi:hypothetical protein
LNPAGLHAYQIPAVEALLRSLQLHGAALDGSDCGVGKSYHAAATIRELDVPTLIVAPAISITAWKRVLKAIGTEADVISYESARQGNTPFGRWENPRPKRLPQYLRCTQCQCELEPDITPPRCPYWSGIHCVELKKRPHDHGEFLWAPEIQFLVFDECHRAGAISSLNAEVLIASRRQNIKTLLLSATVSDSPLGLRAIGYVLKLHELVGAKGFYPWAMGRGCARIFGRGFQFCVAEERKKKILLDIHCEIWPAKGCRIRIEDLGAAFPEMLLLPELYDIAEPARLDRLYREMSEALAAIHEKRELEGENPLTAVLRARMELETLRLPLLAELAEDAQSQGQSVAIFVNFVESVNFLCERLKTTCRVDGSQTGARGQAERQANVDAFQADSSRVIILSIAAGGTAIGLHDLRGQFPRLGLVSPCWSGREFRQVVGRMRRQGGRSRTTYRIVFCANTVEERVQERLKENLDNLDAIVDGTAFAANLN